MLLWINWICIFAYVLKPAPKNVGQKSNMSQASVKRELGEIKSQAKKMAVKHQSYITVKTQKQF